MSRSVALYHRFTWQGGGCARYAQVMRRGVCGLRWVFAISGGWLGLLGCAASKTFAEPGVDAASDAPTSKPPDAALDDPAPWKSGSRLRARVMDGGYGAKLFISWQDPNLRIGCSFALAGDGRIRCLPVDEDTSILTSFYSDDTCTTFIAIGPPPDNPYVRIAEPSCGPSDNDAQPHRVVKWGDVINVAIPYLQRGGVCTPINNAPSFTWHVIRYADPSAFVAATETIHTSPDGLGTRILSAEDGSRENAQFVDPATSKPCAVVSDHVLGGPRQCVPLPFVISPAVPFFDGPGCTQTLAFGKPGCERSKAALVLRMTDCKLAVDLAEVGPSVDTDGGGLFRRWSDGVCETTSRPEPMTAYAVGKPLSTTAFPTTHVRSVGEDRLKALLHAASDGMTIRNAHLLPLRRELDPDDSTSEVQPAPYQFFDTDRQTPCLVTTGTDGTLRCLPTNTVPKLGGYYADAACSQPAHLGSHDPACPSTGFVSLPGWQSIGDAVPPVAEIRPIGPVLQTPPYLVARDIGDPTAPPPGSCVQEPVTPSRLFYTLGDPIPVAALAVVVERTE